jgi:hypothetical protein
MTNANLTVPALLQGRGIIELPDTATHRFRFDIPSESSNKMWRISQRNAKGGGHDGQYECSCPSWIYKRGGDGTGLCKHLKMFKPALDDLVRQAKQLGSKTTPALPAPKATPTKTKASKLTQPVVQPSNGLLDGFDDLEQVSPAKAMLTVKKGQIELNPTAQKKIGNLVQLLYSASKGVIVLKPVDTTDDSFNVDNGVIEATDFLSNVGKVKSGDLELTTVQLKDNVTAYAVTIR